MSKPITSPTLTLLRAMLVAAPPPAVAPVPSKPEVKAKSARTPLKVRRENEIKTRRDPGNRAEHVRVPYLGEAPKTAGAAAKLRREAMHMCPCRLCALALFPPTTFAEYEALGLREASLERVADEVALFLAPRPHTWAVAECFELMTGGVE